MVAAVHFRSATLIDAVKVRKCAVNPVNIKSDNRTDLDVRENASAHEACHGSQCNLKVNGHLRFGLPGRGGGADIHRQAARHEESFQGMIAGAQLEPNQIAELRIRQNSAVHPIPNGSRADLIMLGQLASCSPLLFCVCGPGWCWGKHDFCLTLINPPLMAGFCRWARGRNGCLCHAKNPEETGHRPGVAAGKPANPVRWVNPLECQVWPV